MKLHFCTLVVFLSISKFVEVEGFYQVGSASNHRYQSKRPPNPFNTKPEPTRPSSNGGVKYPTRPNSNIGKIRSPLNLGIILFKDVEVLDVCGPFEVLSIAGERNNGSLKVIMIGDQKIMNARNGLNIVADYVYDDPKLPNLDVLIVPGSILQATRDFLNNQPVLNWIQKIEPKLKYLISVCTGASVLGKLGFVDGLKTTTHHRAFNILQEFGPRAIQRKDCRYTDNGRVLTSAGISAGIDLSLYFVKKIFGADKALEVQDQMEYTHNWEQINPTCIS